MGLLLLALLVQVEVLGLLQPRAAVATGAGRPLQLRAEGERLLVDGTARAGPLRLDGGARGLRLSVPGLAGPRTFPGTLLIWARRGRLQLVDELELEEYVAGVVAAELGPRPEPAAAEALAVVARSFAVRRAAEAAARGPAQAHATSSPLCDQTHCQLFQGRAAAAARAAARATAGRVLLVAAGRVAPALHHAACGGRTSAAAALWPGASADEQEAGTPVDDPLPGGGPPRPACAEGPGEAPLRYAVRLEPAQLAAALGLVPPLHLAIDRDPEGWLRRVEAGGPPLTAEELHLRLGRALGWDRVRSARFTLEESAGDPVGSAGPSLLLRGVGHGHGVGLCQRGAAALAKAGYTAARILARYFPRLRVGALPKGLDPR
jgi:stage II sporulation protein D